MMKEERILGRDAGGEAEEWVEKFLELVTMHSSCRRMTYGHAHSPVVRLKHHRVECAGKHMGFGFGQAQV